MAPGPDSRAGAAAIPACRAWCGLPLAWLLLGLLIWAIYPAKATSRRGLINQGAQPVGVARAVDGDINVTLNALGTVTPLATATVRPQVRRHAGEAEFHRRPDGEGRRYAGPDRPTPLSGGAGPGRGAAGARHRQSRQRQGRPGALSGAAEAECHLRADRGDPGSPGEIRRGRRGPTRPMWKPPASIWAIPTSSRRWTAVPASIWSISAISSPPASPAASWW